MDIERIKHLHRLASGNVIRSRRLKVFLRSFSYTINRRGPNIDSWGTPHFETGFRYEVYFNIFFAVSYRISQS